MSGVRLLSNGEEVEETVLNRPTVDVLTGSGFAADGADFTGFAKGTELTAEQGARAAADTTLQTNVDNEAAARAAAIAAEQTARANADTTLQGHIDAEATARAQAVSDAIDTAAADASTKADAAEANAKAYTYAQAAIDAKDATTLADAAADATTKANAAQAAAIAHADTGDANTLASANAHADTAASDAQAAAIAAAAGDATTKANTAQANAIAAAAADATTKANNAQTTAEAYTDAHFPGPLEGYVPTFRGGSWTTENPAARVDITPQEFTALPTMPAAQESVAGNLFAVFDLTNGLLRTLGLARLIGIVARMLGYFLVTDPKFGALGDGATNDAAAIVNTYAAACAYGAGATVVFPPTNAFYRVHKPAAGASSVTITSPNIETLLLPGAVVKPTGPSPASKAEEQGQYFLYAKGLKGLRVRGGGTFNGNRNDATDPACGFLNFVQCDDVVLADFSVEDCSNAFGGAIAANAWDGATGKVMKNWRVQRLNFRRCTWATHFKNGWQNWLIDDLYFEDMDLADCDGFLKYGQTIYPRCVRLTGYVDTSYAAIGGIGNVQISRIRGRKMSYGIEVWNQDATNGRNPDKVTGILVDGCTIEALYGIGLNSVTGLITGSNTVERLVMDAAAVTAWVAAGGHTQGVFADSSASQGDVMIEARPGYVDVGPVTLLGHYVSGAVPDLTGSCAGIAFGGGDKNIPCETVVSGAKVRDFYRGYNIADCQHSHIQGGRISGCAVPIYCNDRGTNTYGYSGNSIGGELRIDLLPGTTLASLRMIGDWTFGKIEVVGDSTSPAKASPIDLHDNAGTYRMVGPVVRNFAGEAVLDSSLSLTVDELYTDAGSAQAAYGAVTITRRANKVFRFGRIYALNTGAVFAWAGADPGDGSETYYAGTVVTNKLPPHAHRAKSGGTIFPLGFRLDALNATVAPTTGYWAQGNRFEFKAPAAGGKLGAICTATGAALSVQDDGSGTKGVAFVGDATQFASTPDAAANRITGDIDIIVRVKLADWTPATQQSLVSKWATGKFGYRFCVIGAGLNFAMTTDGATTQQVTSTVAAPFADGSIGWVRVQRRQSDGRVQFFTSPEGAVWTQLGADRTLAAGSAMFASTATLELARQNGGSPMTGTLYSATIANALAGAAVVVFDATIQSVGDVAWQASTNEIWSVTGTLTATWKSYGAIDP